MENKIQVLVIYHKNHSPCFLVLEYKKELLFLVQGIANSATGTGHTYCYEYGIGRDWPLHWRRSFGDMGKPS